MRLYHSKHIDVGFVVICPNFNLGQVKSTVNAIRFNYPGSRYVCITPADCQSEEEIGRLSPVVKAGKTITSLINVGMDNAPCEDWNFIVIAGTWVRARLDRKYAYFIDDKKDILFPIVNRKLNFVDGSINGILMQKASFKDVGDMGDDNPLEICKLLWCVDAIAKGHRFKAVLGGMVS